MNWARLLKQRANLLGWLAIVLVIACSSLVRLRLLDLPLERDEGEYGYMAQQLLHGVPPYVSAYSMKLPGVYAVYALNMLAFGQSVRGIHLGLMVFNSATILLLFILGRKLLGNFVGVMAGAAFAVLALGKPVLGLTANAEHFVLLPLLGGVILLLRGLEAHRDRWLLLGALFFGCAVLVKQHAVCFLPFGMLIVFLHGHSGEGAPKSVVLKKLLLFIGACAVPLAVTCLVYLALGHVQELLFWTFVFPRSYVTSISIGSGISRLSAAFVRLLTWAPWLWLMAALGLASVFMAQRAWVRNFLVSWLIFSFCAVAPGLFFRGHYFLLCLPVVSLLAGCGLGYCRRAVAWIVPTQEAAASCVLAAVLFGCSVFPQREILFRLSPEQVSRELYDPDPFSFAACVSVADYLKTHSRLDASVAVVGSEPEIYFYLDRPAVTGFIYLYFLTEKHRFTDRMRQQFIAGMEASAPRFLVYSPSWNSELVSEPAAKTLRSWYDHFVQSHYQLVGVVQMGSSGRTDFKWGKEAEQYTPWARMRMLVYERRSE